MKKIAILQSNYIPWKGYFDMIAAVDEFIFYDDAQYTKNDWRNRNKIKTCQGPIWLSVPVKIKGKSTQQIIETEIANENWAKDHWRTITQNYKKSPFFKVISSLLEAFYVSKKYTLLSELNRDLITEICKYLHIHTKLSISSDFNLIPGRHERVLDLCLQAKATEYISGPAAKSYIQEDDYEKNNIKLTWFSYNDYPEYPQLYGSFIHEVSILDLLFNCGENSYKYMKDVNPPYSPIQKNEMNI